MKNYSEFSRDAFGARLPECSREELNALLLSNIKWIVLDTLLYICFNMDDPEWIQDQCIQLIRASNEEDVRGLAITCIGHVARLYGKINRKKVFPVLDEMLKDETLFGRAKDAYGDIDIFITKANMEKQYYNRKRKEKRKRRAKRKRKLMSR